MFFKAIIIVDIMQHIRLNLRQLRFQASDLGILYWCWIFAVTTSQVRDYKYKFTNSYRMSKLNCKYIFAGLCISNSLVVCFLLEMLKMRNLFERNSVLENT